MMDDVQLIVDPFPHVIIKYMYDEWQMPQIWEELNFLCYEEKLLDPTESGSALTDDGKTLKQNSCIWLDDIYAHPKLSNILKATNDFQTRQLWQICKQHPHWYFNKAQINYTANLISYYEHGGYYKPHNDQAYFTCLTWFYKKPKAFEGGDLHFPEYDYKIECKHNSTVLFPSQIVHAVDEISMNPSMLSNKLGRFCYTQFFSLIPMQQSVRKDYFNIRYIV